MKKNIVILLLDTVRAKDMNNRSTLASLSTINNISRNGTTYTRAVAPGAWTAPTHAALFTNRKVSDIKQVSRDFLTNGTYKIDPWLVKTKFLGGNEQTIASKISKYNYQSTLLSNNPFLTSNTNLAIGFDRVQDVWMDSNVKYNKSFADKFSFILNGGAQAREMMINTGYTVTRLLPKIAMDKMYLSLRRKMYRTTSHVDGTNRLDRGARDTNKLLKDHFSYSYNYKPQFIFINYMEAHEHYPVKDLKVPQDKWMYLGGVDEMSDYNMKQLHRAYLNRLKYLDRSIKSTIGILKQNGVLENATLVLTSDHGQFFGEHKLLYHSMPPYDEVSRVPLFAANYENGKMIKAKDIVETPVSISALHESALNLASGKHDILDGNLRKDK
ncbi:MAG: sulfatase-like hydrolase/transferase, partial [Candidatus Micrarchaeales archaeon]